MTDTSQQPTDVTGQGPNARYPSWGDRAWLWSKVTGQPLGDNKTALAASVSQAENGSGVASTVSSPNNNGTVDIGLWQINSSHIGQSFTGPQGSFKIESQAWLQDPMNNTLAAYAISNGGTNWKPWCTAWSDNACGSRGGTYLGSGSAAVHNYDSALGVATSGSGILGTVTLGAAGTGATTEPGLTGPCPNLGGAANDSALSLFGFTVLNKCQVQQLKGTSLMIGGGVVMLIGTIVVLFRFQGTRRIAETAAAVPVAGGVARTLAGRAPAPRSRARSQGRKVPTGESEEAFQIRRQRAYDTAQAREAGRRSARGGRTLTAEEAAATREGSLLPGEEKF